MGDLERSVAISGDGGGFDGGGGFSMVAVGFQGWGLLAFVSGSDMAGVPWSFVAQRGKWMGGFTHLGCLTVEIGLCNLSHGFQID